MSEPKSKLDELAEALSGRTDFEGNQIICALTPEEAKLLTALIRAGREMRQHLNRYFDYPAAKVNGVVSWDAALGRTNDE